LPVAAFLANSSNIDENPTWAIRIQLQKKTEREKKRNYELQPHLPGPPTNPDPEP
jgi:hypothetical protein